VGASHFLGRPNMSNMGVVRICPGRGNSRAIILATIVFAANLAVGLLAGLAPGFGGAKSTGTDSDPPTRIAQGAEPRISVASAIVAEPASAVSFTVDVLPRDSLPITGFIRVRGLPQFVSINDAHAIGPDSWAVPLYVLPVLRANIPAALSGRTEFEIALVSGDGRILAEARTSLLVVPPSPPGLGRRAAPTPSAAAVEAPPVGMTNPAITPSEPPPLAKTAAEELVAQGERYLAQGKVGGARLFFRQAADAGYAGAAMRLAATYDPAELSILKVQGITPDLLEARKWYERARDLGAVEAEARLARLSDK
jgi:hypothetical protein